jgi:hypothetical protein
MVADGNQVIIVFSFWKDCTQRHLQGEYLKEAHLILLGQRSSTASICYAYGGTEKDTASFLRKYRIRPIHEKHCFEYLISWGLEFNPDVDQLLTR